MCGAVGRDVGGEVRESIGRGDIFWLATLCHPVLVVLVSEFR